MVGRVFSILSGTYCLGLFGFCVEVLKGKKCYFVYLFEGCDICFVLPIEALEE